MNKVDSSGRQGQKIVRKESTLQVKAGNMICYEKENWKSKMTSKGVGATSLLKISKMEF